MRGDITGRLALQVSFIRTWFAGNKVDKFTISIWVKRKGDQTAKAGIVNNGDCIDKPGFELSAENEGVFARLGTDNVDEMQTDTTEVSRK